MVAMEKVVRRMPHVMKTVVVTEREAWARERDAENGTTYDVR